LELEQVYLAHDDLVLLLIFLALSLSLSFKGLVLFYIARAHTSLFGGEKMKIFFTFPRDKTHQNKEREKEETANAGSLAR